LLQTNTNTPSKHAQYVHISYKQFYTSVIQQMCCSICFVGPCAMIFLTELLAPGRPIRALMGLGPHDSDEGSLSAVHRVESVANVANNFCDVAKSFSHVANCRTCNIQRTMLQACCERVPSMLRTRLRATSNIRHLSFPSPTCCDHVATRVVCNIQHQEPSLPLLLLNTTPNITCLQH
jgi:hypothetical protein